MKKKTRLKSRLIDVFIVILCLSVCVFSIYFFYKDLNSFTIRTDKDSIATIVFKQRIAQRKFSDRVVWERLQNNAPLYNEDLLRTSSQSEATITFKNNSVIEIGENTMIQVFYTDDGGVLLSVENGDVQIDTTSVNPTNSNVASFSVKTGDGSIVALSSGSKMSASAKEDSGITNFNVQEGDASITNNKGEESSIMVGETAKIEKTGEVSKGSFNVTSIPNNLKILNFDDKKNIPIELEWNSSEDLAQKTVIIQTSHKKDFSEIEDTYKVKDMNSFILPAKNGTLYWRAFVDESDDSKSQIGENRKIENLIKNKNDVVEGKIRVEKVLPIQTISPMNGNVFSYRKENPKINFSWSGNDFATNYKLEISKTADFSSPIITEEAFIKNISLDSLDEGEYFWKVTPFYPLNNIGYAEPSDIKSFSIVKNAELKPPILSVPSQNATLTYKDSDFYVSFLWKSDVKVSEYDFKIASDEKFENVIYSSNVNGTRIYEDFSKILSIGNYFWKVSRNSLEDENLSQSEVRKFSVIKYVPENTRLVYPPDNFSVEKSKIMTTNFSWKLSDEYKNSTTESIFELSSDENFENILVQKSTDKNSIKNISLEKGKYYWRVGTFDDFENKQIFTNSRILNILGELDSPKIIYPSEGKNLVVLKNSFININWTSVEDADFYKVLVYSSQNGNDLVYSKISYENSVQDFQIPFYVGTDPSQFKISLQSFTEQTDEMPLREGKISSSNFEVRTVDSVKLVSPQNSQNFDGLKALKNPIVIEWKSGKDEPSKATFVLRKVLPSGTTREIQRIENVKNQINLSRLSSGTYEWTILASTKDDLPINAENYRYFTVSQVQNLQKAVLTSPQNDFVIGPSYLRKNRNIVFSWNEVFGATDYTFTLYQRNDDGTIRKIYSEENIKGTSVKFKKLSSLDVGNFEWNVTAYNHAKDGFEEQSGSTSVGKFKIQFNLPTKIKTNDPGRIYGE